jgi:RNA polymerase sigma factor (sigma-70 family)
MIHTLTFRMTGSLADCKDLAQETFVRACRQLDSYQGGAKFSSWLYRITVNACLAWRRQEQRRQRLLHEWSEETATAPSANGSVAPDDSLSRDCAGRPPQTARQTAGGHRAHHLWRAQSRRRRPITWLFGNHRVLAHLLRPAQAEETPGQTRRLA